MGAIEAGWQAAFIAMELPHAPTGAADHAPSVADRDKTPNAWSIECSTPVLAEASSERTGSDDNPVHLFPYAVKT